MIITTAPEIDLSADTGAGASIRPRTPSPLAPSPVPSVILSAFVFGYCVNHFTPALLLQIVSVSMVENVFCNGYLTSFGPTSGGALGSSAAAAAAAGKVQRQSNDRSAASIGSIADAASCPPKRPLIAPSSLPASLLHTCNN